jgi:hypothetical protein
MVLCHFQHLIGKLSTMKLTLPSVAGLLSMAHAKSGISAADVFVRRVFSLIRTVVASYPNECSLADVAA